MPELVLHGIRLLAKQFLGTILDIEVDHSDYVVILCNNFNNEIFIDSNVYEISFYDQSGHC